MLLPENKLHMLLGASQVGWLVRVLQAVVSPNCRAVQAYLHPGLGLMLLLQLL